MILLSAGGPALARNADGTLGLIQRPASTHPALLEAGESFRIAAKAPERASGWEAELVLPETSVAPVELALEDRSYDAKAGRWQLQAAVPEEVPEELYDLRLSHAEDEDTSKIAVQVFEEWPESYTVAHFADTQNLGLPGVTPTMRGIIRDLNALKPTFAVVTGDLVSVGEPHEYRDYIEMLERSRVPTFHVPGNHDIFWVRCDKREAYQERYERYVGPRNYSFDFGDHHYAAVELSGYKSLCPHASLTDEQIEWLEGDLAAADSSPFKVLFGHQREYKADAIESLALDHDLDMYLYGHIHEDAVPRVEPTLFAAVGWAGNGKYRLIDVEQSEIISYTYANYDIESVAGAYAVSRDIRQGQDPRDARIKYTNALAQRFDDVSARVEMPRVDEGRYVVDGGEIGQRVSTEDAEYLYIRDIEIEAEGVTPVEVSWEAPEESEDPPADDEGSSPPESPATGGCSASPGAAGGAAAGALVFAVARMRRRFGARAAARPQS